MSIANDYWLGRSVPAEDLYRCEVLEFVEHITAILPSLSDHPGTLRLRGIWYEMEESFSHQGLLPITDIRLLDQEGGHVGLWPGWSPLLTALHPATEDQRCLAHRRLLELWDNTDLSLRDTLIYWMRLIRDLKHIPYRSQLNMAHYPVFRIAASLPPEWTAEELSKHPELHDFLLQIKSRKQPMLDVLQTRMFSLLQDLYHGVNQIAATGDLLRAYYALIGSLTVLYHFHCAASMENLRSSVTPSDREIMYDMARQTTQFATRLISPKHLGIETL